MAFPQYRIPIERLKEDWARQIAWKHMRRRRPPVPPSKITDNSEPWIRNPSSVEEFWKIACKINETVRERYRNVLPTASLVEVRCMLDRFIDWEVCAMALENPSQDVKDYAIECLREMAADGDLFSQAPLEEREIP